MGKSIRERVERLFQQGRGQSQEKLEALRDELFSITQDELESKAARAAAAEDLLYVQGILETPAALLTDLAYINKKKHKK